MNRPLRGPYRVVLCDVGETLVHYKRSFSATISAEAARLGAQVAMSEVRRIGDEEYDRAIRNPAARGSSADADRSRAFWQGMYAAMGRRLGVSDPALLAQRLFDEFTTVESYDAIDGAREALTRIRAAGLKLVAASNWEPWLLDLLDHLELRESFDALAVSGLIGVEKPDAAFFERTLEIAGATRDETVHIGDSFYADVQGAWGAGLDAIWINWHNRPAQACPTVATIGAAADAVIAASGNGAA